MPERDSLQEIFTAEQNVMAKRLEEMQVEYNNKLEVYMNQRDTLTDFVLKNKEAELADIDTRIREYEQTATQALQQRQNELLAPVYEKINVALKAVAQENKFTYILDLSMGSVLYFDESDESLNVLPLLKAKLGLQ